MILGCGGKGVVIAPGDMGGADAGPIVPPTFFAGDYVAFPGVTTDNHAIVIDRARTAWAIRLSDGTRAKIADNTRTAWVFYDAVFVEHDSINYYGALTLWHGDGPAVALTDATPDDSFAFSFPTADKDGHIAYWVKGATQNDLVVDDVTHAAPHTVLTGVELSPTSGACWPYLQYFSGRLLGTHCTGGGTTRTLTSWDAASGAAVDLLASSTTGFGTRSGLGVLTIATTGALALAAADGSGTPRALATDAKQARFSRDGSAVFVVTSGGALERIALSGGAVTPLIASGVERLIGLSADGKLATYSTMTDPTSFADDLWLTSATTASATPTPLLTTATGGTLGYDFTDDNAYTFWGASYDGNTLTGTLHARETSAAGVDRVLGNAVYTVAPVGGAKIVFGANHSGSFPDDLVDLELADLTSAANPQKIATQVLAFWETSEDGKTLWYVQPNDGLHAFAVP